MPLVPATLQTNLSKIIDPPDPNLHPDTTQLAITNFANAINGYASLVFPLSVGATPGVQAFISTMSPLNAPPTQPPSTTFMILFPQAMLAYATALGVGMAPAFASTPPVSPLNLDSVWQIGLNNGTAQAVVSAMVPIIDTWFRTGIAINSVSGVTTPWL